VVLLTGGASATYGSDAVAGVVNFIMKRNFEGLQIDAQWGVNQHKQHTDLMQTLLARSGVPVKDKVWDGKSRDLSIMFGANAPDGKGNVTAYFTYHDLDPVLFASRDFAACQLNVSATGVPACAGSPNSNQWYEASASRPTFAVVGNTFQVYSPTANTTPPALFNSNPYEYLQHQDTRYTGGFFADYEINKHFEVYSDFQYMHDRSTTQVAPSGLFQGSGATANGGFLVNCSNPLISGQQISFLQGQGFCLNPATDNVDLVIGRRNIEGGGRQSFYEHQNYRAVGGVRGEIVDPWKYDLYGSYYYTTVYQANQNYFSIARIQNALQVVNSPTGPVCISGGTCVPYNIFNTGGVTQAQVDYLNGLGTSYGSMREAIIEGTITGDLGKYGVKSPWADDGVGVAFGFHNRRDHMIYRPDEAELSGDLSGFGGASTPIDNSLRVTEVYGEARVPLVQKHPWVEDLLLEAGYRYSDYSTGIQAKTYKLGLQYAPTDDIRFRVSYQKAIRAPNILELYTPQAATNTSQLAGDPCTTTVNPDGSTTPPTATLAQCLNTGITAAQYGVIPQCPSSQCAVLNGGNPNLGPETAKTFSVGFTLTPSFIRGFTASADFYDIRLQDVIGAIPLGVIVNNCLSTGDPTFCNQIIRAPNGTLFGTTVVGGGYVNGTSVNIGAEKFTGIDFQAGYNLPLEAVGLDDWGSLSFNFTGSYLINAKFKTLPTEPTYDCAGLFGPQCQNVLPYWRHSLRVSWKTPWNVLASVQWRYIGEAKLETDTSQPTIGNGGTDVFNHLLPARNYLDVSGTWNVNDMFTVRAGITNILDQDPPLVRAALSQTGSPNTYSTYDLLGRHMFIGFTANF
jgi:outer membrane receptor protein involved in Fe transport